MRRRATLTAQRNRRILNQVIMRRSQRHNELIQPLAQEEFSALEPAQQVANNAIKTIKNN